MKVQGIRCPRCLDDIWSRHGHDFRYCGCGYCFVDGGRNYLRYGHGDQVTGSTADGVPSIIELDVPDSATIPKRVQKKKKSK